MEPKTIKLIDLNSNRHVILKGNHDRRCDANPVNLTWAKNILPGVKIWICTSCYARVLRKYKVGE